MIKIKLCGFKDQETLSLAISKNVDFVGFVFHKKSPRNISLKKAAQISSSIPKKVKKVAVISNPTNEKISQIKKHLKVDFLQIHGNQSPQRIQKIKNIFHIPIIKAFSIDTKEDLLSINKYEEFIDMFLFDAKQPGSGQKFDWKILNSLKISKNWLLSGGININNIDKAIKETGAQIIDLSSGIEEERGIKSPKLILELMNHIKQIRDHSSNCVKC